MINGAIKRLVDGEHLDRKAMRELFASMMESEISEAQKSALLVALRMKGETVDEVTGAVEAMRERVTRLDVDGVRVIDTCGTGGDGRGTFNVSTVAAIVAASAGAIVAKHGNRGVSSKSGSADVLAALGVKINLGPDGAAETLRRVGISFLFAPNFHPAMKAVAGVRRDLGIRTIFNVLGPLTNPAMAKRQVMGVYASRLRETVAGVLRELGAEHALVVHSADGLDEISVSDATDVTEVRDGELRSYRIAPEEIGVGRHPLESVLGGDPEENASIALRILDGEKGAPRDIVVVNAGAALYVAGVASSIPEGVVLASEAIDSGAARAKLDELVEVSGRVGGEA